MTCPDKSTIVMHGRPSWGVVIGVIGMFLTAVASCPSLKWSHHVPTGHHMPREVHASGEPVCFSKKRVVLIGDSTMAFTASAFANMFNCTVVREGSRCDFESYYGYPARQDTYKKPVPPGVGPVHHGLSVRGCMDCKGCHPREWYCSVPDLTVEFLGSEFARDVEYPTAWGDYTQEGILKGYLAQNLSTPPYAIVFNTGLHDLAIAFSNETAALWSYASNLGWLVSALTETFPSETKLLWISTSQVVAAAQAQAWRAVTNNRRIVEFNTAAENVMRKAQIPTLDVFSISGIPEFQALSRDGVHIGTSTQFYYRFVAIKIALALCA